MRTGRCHGGGVFIYRLCLSCIFCTTLANLKSHNASRGANQPMGLCGQQLNHLLRHIVCTKDESHAAA